MLDRIDQLGNSVPHPFCVCVFFVSIEFLSPLGSINFLLIMIEKNPFLLHCLPDLLL